MAIPSQFIDEVVARTNLVELVGEFVSLTPKGGNYWGLCPFHLEKSPSFSVSQSKGIYKCFGCGKGGGAINFVMEQENLPYLDAVEFLAKRVGMTMPEQTYADRGFAQKRDRLLEINRQAAIYFHKNLYLSQGEQGLTYLKNRALSQGTLTRFGLGFALDSWDSLIVHMQSLEFSKGELIEAGLAVSNKDGRIYDRFRNRVMFPIINVKGSVIGFGGRVMDDSTPKYLNSPETPIFNKSRNLFGLNVARKTKSGAVILTEGYMDTIALHQAGFDGAVASLGTSLTAEHAQLLARYFKNSVIAYDSDGAGISAVHRAIPLLEKAGLAVKVLEMKGAKDPDEYIKSFGRDAFIRLLEHSENHIEYRMEQIAKKYNLNEAPQQVAYLQEIAQFLSTLQSPVEREVYGGRAAELAGVSKETVAQEVARSTAMRINQQKKQETRKNLVPSTALQPVARTLHYQNIRSALAEEGLLRVVLHDPAQLVTLGSLTAINFTSPLLGRVFELLKNRYHQGLAVAIAPLANELAPEEMSHLAQVAEKPQDLSNLDRAREDYLAILQEEIHKNITNEINPLLAAKQRNKEKKAFLMPSEE